jgi:hypothetical protein
MDGGNIWTVRFAECRWVRLVSEKRYMPANDALLRVVGIFRALTSTAPRVVWIAANFSRRRRGFSCGLRKRKEGERASGGSRYRREPEEVWELPRVDDAAHPLLCLSF